MMFTNVLWTFGILLETIPKIKQNWLTLMSTLVCRASNNLFSLSVDDAA